MLTVDIRPLLKDELLHVEHFIVKPNHPTIHADRLSRQHAQEVTYLIAWRDNRPLGHLLIEWNGAKDTFVQERVEPSPYLEDMLVLENYRSLSIGSQLIRTAENLIRNEGYATASLAVAVDNSRAITFYQKHGFVESDIGTYIVSGTFTAENSEAKVWKAECLYMTKSLA